MKCAYNAGILDAFLDNDIGFDYVIGVSAGSANAASYLAGQRGRNIRFYTLHNRSPEYFGARPFFRDGNLFNLPYVYGDLTNSDGIDPIDHKAMMDNPAEFRIVATDAMTGLPRYFSKDEIVRDDYRVIMASCAMPAACRPVIIDGRPYYDGGVSDSIPIARALADGCDRVVAILSNPRDFVKRPERTRPAYTVLCRQYPDIVRDLDRRHKDYNRAKELLLRLESEGRAFVFAPPFRLGTFTTDKAELRELYNIAVADCCARGQELEEFLNKRV